MRKNLLVFVWVALLIASLVSSLNMVNDRSIPFAYAQTNSAALATLVANNSNNSNITDNASSTAAAVTTFATNNTTEALQIKNGVNYFDNASGYLVYPTAVNNTTVDTTASNNKLPAVIMIHENRGLNDNIKSMANTLSKEGYVVLAVDLFKGQVAVTSQQTQQLTSSVRSDPISTISNLQSAVKYVSSLPFVDSSKIASIGWCFGGGQSLQLALNSQNHPLVATILYYGTPLITDAQQLSKIKWPILGIFGDKDQANPLPLINKFKVALDANKINNDILIYRGLGHAFANPSNQNYAPKETADAWQKTLSFLKKYV